MQVKTIERKKSKEIDEIEELRESIKKRIKEIDKNWVDISLDLWYIYQDDIYYIWGYERFKDYIEDELDVGYRTIAYRVKIGKAIEQYNIDKNIISEIGWSKFKELLPFLSPSKKRNEILFKMAMEMSLRELQAKLKKPTEKEVKRYSFSFNMEQAEIIEKALSLGGSMLGTTDKSRILEAILSDWLMNNLEEKGEKDG